MYGFIDVTCDDTRLFIRYAQVICESSLLLEALILWEPDVHLKTESNGLTTNHAVALLHTSHAGRPCSSS
jgi:hypothetical protein